MKGYFRKFIFLFTAGLVSLFFLFNIGCTGSKTNKFHTKIQRMSNDDLLNAYQGINDRIKDIDSGNEREVSSEQNQQERLISNMPFMIGGEGYNLNQKRKMILKELNTRGVTP